MMNVIDGRFGLRAHTQGEAENRPACGVDIVAERPNGNLLGGFDTTVEIREIKRAEARHQALLAELNHRVKNNMQMLDALLRGARRRTGNPEAQAVLADACRRVGAMAAAQQVLYGAGDTLEFDAQGFLDALAAPVRHEYGRRIALSVEAVIATLPTDTATPLALIINELIVNAATHGLNGREHGQIAIRLWNDGEFVLSVEDDGPGFDIVAPLGYSSGLGLVQGLARQLRGKFDVTRQPGACCMLRFADPRQLH
jgi:two-component sensor histidine kinase